MCVVCEVCEYVSTCMCSKEYIIYERQNDHMFKIFTTVCNNYLTTVVVSPGSVMTPYTNVFSSVKVRLDQVIPSSQV